MKRITQSLFEEIEKITSGQIEEKKKVDHDKDRDNDFADVMMARMKAGGKSHKEAHKHTRKHNEEAEQEGNQIDEISIETMKSAKEKLGGRAMDAHYDDNKWMAQKYAIRALNMKSRIAKKQRQMDSKKTNEEADQLDEIGDTPAGKKALGSYVKKRTKQLPDIEVGYQMAEPGRQLKGYTKLKKKVNTGIGRAVDRLTKEEAEIEEAWPGTAEYKAKHGTEEEKWEAKYGKSDAKKLEPYGYRGASGSDTEEKPDNISKPKGRGRKAGGSKLNKMKEETIVKHEDFIITVTDNPTFQDFFNAAKSYVDNEDDAVVVAEAFYKDEDNSIIIESEVKYLYNNVFEDHKKDGYLVEDIDVVIREEEVLLKYSAIKENSVVKYNYIHHGIVVAEEKGEE